MKKHILIIIVFLSIGFSTHAQKDKDTPHLAALYEDKAYEDIKAYKPKRIKKFSSEALFYKAMAYYMTKDDKKTLEFLDLAITKGPASPDMYYYKSVTHYYLNKTKEAIEAIDNAIALDNDVPDFYSLKGQFHQTVEEYDKAIVAFKKALSLMNITNPSYANIQYNLALSQQLGKDYVEARKTFEECLRFSPDDFQAMSKLIQVLYASDLAEDSNPIKEKLFDAHKKGLLPEHMKNMYCYEQFEWNDITVMAFEAFEPQEKLLSTWKHKFFVLDKTGQIDYKIQTELDKTSRRYKPALVKNGVRSFFNNYSFENNAEHRELKKAVIEILSGNVAAEKIENDYGKLLDENAAEKSGLSELKDDGSSFKKAVKVNSISEEYAWIRKYYPGSSFQGQSLIFEKKKPFDVLTIITANGTKKEIHFDISSFFGKGF